MPTLSWRTGDEVDPAARVAVMASRFRVRRHRDVPRFLLDSLLIRRQIRSTPGALAMGLKAYPLRREFLTLSSWSDGRAIRMAVRAEPHASALQRHRAAMTEATFALYEVAGTAFPPTWADASRRLDQSQADKNSRRDTPGLRQHGPHD